MVARPATWRIILLPLEGTPDLVREHVETNRARIDERIEHLVRLELERFGVPVVLDVELVAKAIRHLGEEAGRMVLTNPARYGPERLERFVDSLARLLWPGQ